MSDFYGPALPPGFNAQGEVSASTSKPKNVEDDEHIYGPSLPPGLKLNVPSKSRESSDSSPDSSSSDDEPETSRRIGPIGPAMPPGFKMDRSENDSAEDIPSGSSTDTGQHKIGPILPPGFIQTDQEILDYEEDDVYGPLPPTGNEQKYSAAEEFEQRALKMKRKLDGSDSKDSGPAQRDSWMTELPDKLSQAFSGTTARKFRANAAPEISEEDRSLWTETPVDKERREQEEREGKHKHKKRKHEHKVTSERDKRMRKQTEEYNKSTKRTESLLEMHQKKLKKKKKEKKKKGEKEKTERRPFDRELDLQTNVFDDAKRKAIIKRASNLGTKFGHGGVEFL